ncbi:dethiobiotin synthase [Phenylobacterium sp.]|jgi:dethiobiotin synthetase|uniref:dethiobiotin synthase n=1 Tax=Phenylobacterium sp. TaxID=1871053 RepID=UPI002F41B046
MTLSLFIAGSHTDIGKTHVACALIRAARAQGLVVEALKPIASGFDPTDWADSDPGRLLAALGEAPSAVALDRITPWRYAAPLAPPSAARLEGRTLPLEPLIDLCAGRLAASAADLFLLESAGGLMSPLADDGICLDLLDALCLPVLLVGGGYLGAMSHTLTAAEVARGRGHPLRAIVVSQDADPTAPDFTETRSLIAAHAGGVPVFPAPRGGDQAWAQSLLAALIDLPVSAPA